MGGGWDVFRGGVLLGSVSVPPDGLALWGGYGGGLGGTSPLHLAVWPSGPCVCLQGFLVRTLGILRKAEYTSYLIP